MVDQTVQNDLKTEGWPEDCLLIPALHQHRHAPQDEGRLSWGSELSIFDNNNNKNKSYYRFVPVWWKRNQTTRRSVRNIKIFSWSYFGRKTSWPKSSFIYMKPPEAWVFLLARRKIEYFVSSVQRQLRSQWMKSTARWERGRYHHKKRIKDGSRLWLAKVLGWTWPMTATLSSFSTSLAPLAALYGDAHHHNSSK